MGTFFTAQICEDGHVIHTNIQKNPERNQKYCDKCGQMTITKCTNCQTEIRGEYNEEGVISFTAYEVPSFCHECGHPYPWIQNSIDAMMELMEFENAFTDRDKEEMKNALIDISNESSKTELGVTKIKKAIHQVSPTMKDIFIRIIINIASEKVKRDLGL